MRSNVIDAHGLSVDALRQAVSGRVIGPDEADYDGARRLFYAKFDRRPWAIVRPANAGEVARVVGLAREAGMALAVRSGGHSLAGHSGVEGGLVLDLAAMKGLAIDATGRTAWAETGLTAGEYTAAAAAHGLATGFGDTASVGIGGLTLGGGVGYLVRQHGLTIDSLLAAEVVTASGQQLYADAETHPDLFWALRGGGGNFGVATRFLFRLHPVDTVVGGMLVLPATPATVAGFMAAAAAAPEALSTIANIMLAPPMPFLPGEQHGRPVLFGMLCYAGAPAEGEAAMRPFRALAAPLADDVGPKGYRELFTTFEEGPIPPQEVARTLFMDAVDEGTAATILEWLQASSAPFAAAQLRALGGAMARVPNEATAFAHRDRPVMAVMAALYERAEETPAHTAWIEGFAAALAQGQAGAYVNFLGDACEARVRLAYPGATWDRLRAIKARYDPGNFFKLNQNIPPAASA